MSAILLTKPFLALSELSTLFALFDRYVFRSSTCPIIDDAVKSPVLLVSAVGANRPSTNKSTCVNAEPPGALDGKRNVLRKKLPIAFTNFSNALSGSPLGFIPASFCLNTGLLIASATKSFTDSAP